MRALLLVLLVAVGGCDEAPPTSDANGFSCQPACYQDAGLVCSPNCYADAGARSSSR